MKKDVAVKRFLRTRMTFSQSKMVTVCVAKIDYMQMFDIHRLGDSRITINEWVIATCFCHAQQLLKAIAYVRPLGQVHPSPKQQNSSPTYRIHYFSDINTS